MPVFRLLFTLPCVDIDTKNGGLSGSKGTIAQNFLATFSPDFPFMLLQPCDFFLI